MSYCMGCIVLVRCVLMLRCGSAGVVWCLRAGLSTSSISNSSSSSSSSGASACIRIPHHHNVTPTHIEPEQYNP